jgi:putative ABC transport system permease protein
LPSLNPLPADNIVISFSYWFEAFRAARKNLALRKLRSGLALLGIVLGVGSVIAMLAVGEGSKAAAVAQIRALGAANVIVRSVKPGQRPSAQEGEGTIAQQKVNRVVEYGLKYADLQRLREGLPTLTKAIPVALVRKDVQHGPRRVRNARIKGVTPDYLGVKLLRVHRGRFISDPDGRTAENVAVLGAQAARELFGYTDPMGKDLLMGPMAFRVVGVLAPSHDEAANEEVFIPLEAARGRFGQLQVVRTAGSLDLERTQLAEIILVARDSGLVPATAQMARSLLDVAHRRDQDYEIQVPLELLARAENEKFLWNLVLGSIAGIALVVGGIGIMNIMLANVTEQTREIGIRRAIGARRCDIVAQFLTESVVLSSAGGALGVALGLALPWLVESLAGIDAIVRPWSVLVAFTISGAIGVIFGIFPARRAARMEPIQALRHT